MAIVLTDFDKIWGSTSPLTPYSFSDANYQEGWNFIGATPPSRQMWDSYMKWSDEKQQYIVQNFLPLSGGTMTGTVTFSDSSLTVTTKRTTNDSLSMYCSGTAYNVGSALRLYGKDHNSIYAGSFIVAAADDNGSKYLVGKPDGTLTWGGTDLVPVGVVQAFAGSTTPSGWLLCNGSAVSRTTYAKLFSVIGTTYGVGDGSTTFNLPDLVDKFIEGSGTSGTEKTAGLPNITGYFEPRNMGSNSTCLSPTGAFGGASRSVESYTPLQANSTAVTVRQQISFDASSSNAIYGNSTTVQPPALTMRYIIKY